MRNFHPTQPGFLAASTEEPYAAARQSIVRPEIHYLALGHDSKVAAAHIDHNAVQSVGASGNRKWLHYVRSLFAVGDGVPDHLYLRHWTGFYNHKFKRMEVVQVCGAKGATHGLLIDFAQKFKAVVRQIGARFENRQRARPNKTGRII